MTERGSPSRHNSITSDDSTTDSDFHPLSHVVQIPPADQKLHRDAAAAKRRTFPEKYKRRDSFLGKFCVFCCAFLVAIIILLLLLYIFFQPKLPIISVHSFVVDSVVPGFHTEFRVGLTVCNPNPKSEVLYKTGAAALLFSDHEQLIGNGSFPSFNQAQNETTDVDVIIKQSNSNGALQILYVEKLLKQLTHQDFINLVFKMSLVTRFENWSVIWGEQTVAVDCHLSVYTLAKRSTLLDQVCRTDKG